MTENIFSRGPGAIAGPNQLRKNNPELEKIAKAMDEFISSEKELQKQREIFEKNKAEQFAEKQASIQKEEDDILNKEAELNQKKIAAEALNAEEEKISAAKEEIRKRKEELAGQSGPTMPDELQNEPVFNPEYVKKLEETLKAAKNGISALEELKKKREAEDEEERIRNLESAEAKKSRKLQEDLAAYYSDLAKSKQDKEFFEYLHNHPFFDEEQEDKTRYIKDAEDKPVFASYRLKGRDGNLSDISMVNSGTNVFLDRPEGNHHKFTTEQAVAIVMGCYANGWTEICTTGNFEERRIIQTVAQSMGLKVANELSMTGEENQKLKAAVDEDMDLFFANKLAFKIDYGTGRIIKTENTAAEEQKPQASVTEPVAEEKVPETVQETKPEEKIAETTTTESEASVPENKDETVVSAPEQAVSEEKQKIEAGWQVIEKIVQYTAIVAKDINDKTIKASEAAGNIRSPEEKSKLAFEKYPDQTREIRLLKEFLCNTQEVQRKAPENGDKIAAFVNEIGITEKDVDIYINRYDITGQKTVYMQNDSDFTALFNKTRELKKSL